MSSLVNNAINFVCSNYQPTHPIMRVGMGCYWLYRPVCDLIAQVFQDKMCHNHREFELGNGRMSRKGSVIEDKVKESLAPFIRKYGIREDVKIIEAFHESIFGASGDNFFLKKDAVIIVPPWIDLIDEEAATFVLMHEFTHIQRNDCRWRNLTRISSTALFVILALSTDWIPSDFYLLAMLLSEPLIKLVYERSQEVYADDVAIKEASIPQLLGGRRFYKVCQYLKKEAVYDEHPSAASRIAKIEKELKDRGIDSIDEDAEDEKTKRLKEYVGRIDASRNNAAQGSSWYSEYAELYLSSFSENESE